MLNTGHTRLNLAAVERLIRDLSELRHELIETEAKSEPLLPNVHPLQLKSARNLVHYLALRRTDLRPLQTRLTATFR